MLANPLRQTRRPASAGLLCYGERVDWLLRLDEAGRLVCDELVSAWPRMRTWTR